MIRISEINAQIEHNIEKNELISTFIFNAMSGDETGNSLTHSKCFVQDFKFGPNVSLLDEIQELENKYFTLLSKVFGDVDNLLQDIRMVAPVTGEGLGWDASKMVKIKIIQEIQKTKE